MRHQGTVTAPKTKNRTISNYQQGPSANIVSVITKDWQSIQAVLQDKTKFEDK